MQMQCITPGHRPTDSPLKAHLVGDNVHAKLQPDHVGLQHAEEKFILKAYPDLLPARVRHSGQHKAGGGQVHTTW